MGTESGSRVLSSECDDKRGFGVAIAEEMMLAALGSAVVGTDAERSICGTSVNADLAGESGSEAARDVDAVRMVSGNDVNIFVAGSTVVGLRRTTSAGISTYSNVAIVDNDELKGWIVIFYFSVFQEWAFHCTATHLRHRRRRRRDSV